LHLDRTEEFFRLTGKLYNPIQAEDQLEFEREEDEEDLAEEMLDRKNFVFFSFF